MTDVAAVVGAVDASVVVVTGAEVVVVTTAPVVEVTVVTTVVGGATTVVVGAAAVVDVVVVEELTELAGWISCTGFVDGLVAIASTPTPSAAAASTPPAMPLKPFVAIPPASATADALSMEAP